MSTATYFFPSAIPSEVQIPSRVLFIAFFHPTWLHVDFSCSLGCLRYPTSVQQVFDEYCSICRYIPYVLVQLSLSVKSNSL